MLPKIIHFAWLSDLGVEIPEDCAGTPASWASANPGWEVKFWDDESSLALVESDFPEMMPTWEALPRAVMRSDLVRFLALIKFGGVYLDVDLKLFPGRRRPLDSFLDSGVVFNRYSKGPPLPQVPSEDYVDLKATPAILSRENCRLDAQGYGFANGFMMMHPGRPWAQEFVEAQKGAYKGKVLDFMGPWALTRFLRAKGAADPVNMGKEILMIPAHYFLWERARMKCDPAPYAVSEHTGENTWGDKEKRAWWNI